MYSPARELRGAARSVLPAGAFLRRDRGCALFVSDAPRLCPPAQLAEALADAGFVHEIGDGLVRLWPGPDWLTGFEARFPEPPDAFCASLVRFRGLRAEPESLELFALAARIMEGEPNGGFERRLRQRAAECLRMNAMNRTSIHGGGLYACALGRHLIKEA